MTAHDYRANFVAVTDPDRNVSENGIQKDTAAVRIFPPAVPLLTVFAGIALEQVLPFGSDLMLLSWLRYLIGGGTIIASVYLLGFKAVRTIRLSGQSENPWEKTTEIIETGPYKLTRNPMYLQMVLVCIGFAVLLSNIWIFVITPISALVLHFLVILPEERYLERKFGDTYLDYKRRVRCWV